MDLRTLVSESHVVDGRYKLEKSILIEIVYSKS